MMMGRIDSETIPISFGTIHLRLPFKNLPLPPIVDERERIYHAGRLNKSLSGSYRRKRRWQEGESLKLRPAFPEQRYPVAAKSTCPFSRLSGHATLLAHRGGSQIIASAAKCEPPHPTPLIHGTRNHRSECVRLRVSCA